MNYEQEMYIDEDALDVECLNQPGLMMRYSQKLAELKQQRDLEKETLDFTIAELDKEIRDDPESFELSKLTETVIQNIIKTTKKYKAAMNAYLQSKHEVDVCQGAVSAVEQRKSMIEALIRLHGQNYFAGPSVPHNLTELREKKAKNSTQKIAERMRRTKA